MSSHALAWPTAGSIWCQCFGFRRTAVRVGDLQQAAGQRVGRGVLHVHVLQQAHEHLLVPAEGLLAVPHVLHAAAASEPRAGLLPRHRAPRRLHCIAV